MRKLRDLKRPGSLDGIISTFGDINNYLIPSASGILTLDPAFERKYIQRIKLPYPLAAAWDHNKKISSFRCHRLLADRFEALFETISEKDLIAQAGYFGGCFHFRQKGNGSGISTHSWGIAIDINPETNRQGNHGDMSPEIVGIFKDFGFIWGGDWSGKACDPMHFQYCRGY
jgi:hypothetical protein